MARYQVVVSKKLQTFTIEMVGKIISENAPFNGFSCSSAPTAMHDSEREAKQPNPVQNNSKKIIR